MLGDPICVRTLSSHCRGPLRCSSIQQGVLVTVWRLQGTEEEVLQNKDYLVFGKSSQPSSFSQKKKQTYGQIYLHFLSCWKPFKTFPRDVFSLECLVPEIWHAALTVQWESPCSGCPNEFTLYFMSSTALHACCIPPITQLFLAFLQQHHLQHP